MSFSSKAKVVALMAVVLAIFASFSSNSEAGFHHRACCYPAPICCGGCFAPACVPGPCCPWRCHFAPCYVPCYDPCFDFCCGPFVPGPYGPVVPGPAVLPPYGCGSCGGGYTVPPMTAVPPTTPQPGYSIAPMVPAPATQQPAATPAAGN